MEYCKGGSLGAYPLTITILVKSSTGISDLSSLQGERLAIISYISHVGGIKATTLLTASGLDLNKGKILEKLFKKNIHSSH